VNVSENQSVREGLSGKAHGFGLTNKAKTIFLFFFLTLSLANIPGTYVAGSPLEKYLFNSDALYLPVLFSDIFQNGGRIKDWFLTPAPYFFPDYLMFMIAYLIGATPYSQIISFSLIQIALTFFAIWFLAKATVNYNSFFTASTTLVVLIWLAFNAVEPFIFILVSAHHYGVFISALLLSAIWIKFNHRDKIKNRSLFILLTAAVAYITSLSDNLFIVQFVVPLIATEILISIAEHKFSLKNHIPLILVAIYSLFGSMSYNLVVHNPTRYPIVMGIDKISFNLKCVSEQIFSVLTDRPVLGLMFLIYLCIALISFAKIIKDKKNGCELSWIAVFSFLSACATIGTVSLMTNLPVRSRYLIPVFSWPVIVVFIFLSYRLRNRFPNLAIAISLLTLAPMSWSAYRSIISNGIVKQYYPEVISCIDDVLERENLHNGIAQYWDAKYMQAFSRLNLNIAQYVDNLSEMRWITSKRYFKPFYDFAIISVDATPPYKISSELLTRINGAPKCVKFCGNKIVLIYGKDKMRVR
jgi:hypothetical protein